MLSHKMFHAHCSHAPKLCKQCDEVNEVDLLLDCPILLALTKKKNIYFIASFLVLAVHVLFFITVNCTYHNSPSLPFGALEWIFVHHIVFLFS